MLIPPLYFNTDILQTDSDYNTSGIRCSLPIMLGDASADYMLLSSLHTCYYLLFTGLLLLLRNTMCRT